MSEESPGVAGGTLGLRSRELVGQFEFLLQLGIVRYRHDDKVPFTVSGDKDGFVGRVRQVRDLVGIESTVAGT